MVVPVVAVGAGADAAGCDVAPEVLLKSEDPGALDAAVELVVVLPPPRAGKSEEPEVAVVVPVPLAAVVEAVVGAADEAGVFPPSLGKPKLVEFPPVVVLDDVAADENKPLGASEPVAAGLLPPRLRVLEGVVLG